MLFNTIQYAFFLIIVVAAFYALRKSRGARLWLLLAASYFFYASWNIFFLPLILGLSQFNYFLGLWSGKAKKLDNVWLARFVLVIALLGNLGVLFSFKYLAFLFSSLAQALSWTGLKLDFPPITPLLPLGISFFVFEFIHYQVDINRGSVPVKNWLEFSIFGAFFPTQIAGPIKRYEDFVPQLNRQPSFSLPRIGEGLKYILWGLFKKVVLADNLAPLVAIGFGQAVGWAGGNASLSSGDAWLTVLAFTLQIYFDFSGYTDMGRGSAMLLGFNVPENFKFPYLAANISDFWRRWHITLSGWLRDYIYIPLGGNRKGRYRNLLITMVLGGLWHGANWTFIIWGLYHGIGLTIFWLWRSLGLNFDRFRVWKLLSWGATFLFVFFGWIFFRSENLDQAGSMFKAVLAMNNGPANVFFDYERIFILTVLISWGIVEITLMNKTWLKDHLPQGSTALIQFLRPTIYSLILVLILLLNPANSGPQFIYFQF